jgi:hydrophobe/amphiphile efflux-3 (HAE3) family protein
MNRRWRRAGEVLSARTGIVLVAALAVVVVLATGLPRLEFATGQDSFLDPSSTTAQDNERYQDLFGGETMVVLFTMDEGTDVVDLFTPTNLAHFEEIDAALGSDPTFSSVITPTVALTWTQDLVTSGAASGILARAAERETDPAAVAARQAGDVLTVVRAGAAGEQSFANPDWVRFLLLDNEGFTTDADGAPVAPAEPVVRPALRSFFPDTTHGVLAAVVLGNASLDELAEATAAVEAAFEGRTFDNATVTITGTPTFLTDINDYLQGGMLTLGAIAVGVMALVLLLLFRVRWRLLPLVVVLLGVAGAFGLFGYLGIPLSLVTISGLPILIGIGVDFAIQIHSRVEEECIVDRDRSPFAATLDRLGPALVAATVAAVLAFLVMRISRVPMIRDFGILLAVGIVVLLAIGVVVPMAVLGARERRRASTGPVVDGLVGRAVSWLGAAPAWTAVPFVVLALVVPVVGLVVEDGVPIESDPINWADPDSESVVNARTLEDEAGFATTLGVFVETEGFDEDGIFTDQLAAFTHDLVFAELEAHDELVRASSLVTTVSLLIAVPGATPLPPLGVDLLAAYDVAPEPVQRLLVADDGNAANVLFQVAPSSLEDRAVVVDELEAAIADPGDGAKVPDNASATPAGLAIVGVGLLENLTANRALLTITALAVVALWLVLRFGNLPRALLAMVPIAFAVGFSSIVVWALGITLSPMTTVGGPLVIATCGEFAVLILDRYLEERRDNGYDPQTATDVASVRTGRAFTASALTTVGGFGVLMFAPLPLLKDFGAVVTLNVAIALLSALVVLPPLLRAADARALVHAEGAVPVLGRRPATVVAASLLAVVSVTSLGFGLADPEDDAPEVQTVPATDEPAVRTTTTQAPPPETVAPGDTLPPGPAERPGGLVAGALFDALTAAGADPGVARCTADDLLATTSEPDLLALGIASSPPSAEATALVAAAAQRCGVPAEVLALVAAG